LTNSNPSKQLVESRRTIDFYHIESTAKYQLARNLERAENGMWQVLGHARHSENEGNYLVIINPFTGPPFVVRTATRVLDTDSLAMSWNIPFSPRELKGDKYNIRLGRYRHYKGGIYLVIGTAVDVDDKDREPLIVYIPLYTHEGHAIAIRPKAMFEGFVEVESDFPKEITDQFPNLAKPSQQPRFKFIPY